MQFLSSFANRMAAACAAIAITVMMMGASVSVPANDAIYGMGVLA